MPFTYNPEGFFFFFLFVCMAGDVGGNTDPLYSIENKLSAYMVGLPVLSELYIWLAL